MRKYYFAFILIVICLCITVFITEKISSTKSNTEKIFTIEDTQVLGIKIDMGKDEID